MVRMTGYTMSWGTVCAILAIAAICCAVDTSTSISSSTSETTEISTTSETVTSSMITTTSTPTTTTTASTTTTTASTTTTTAPATTSTEITTTAITIISTAAMTTTAISETSTNFSSAQTSESSNSSGIITSISTSPTQPVFNTSHSPQTDLTITIIIGASVGGAAFVMLVVVVISLVVCRRRRVLCWKRKVPASDSKDSLTDIPTNRNQGYDMWSLDSGIGKDACPSLSNAESGTANEGFTVDPNPSCQDKDQPLENQITGSESDSKENGPEVYAVVNKVKHPARHEYTNVSVKERSTPGNTEKAPTSPTLVRQLEEMLKRSPKSTKRSPLLPLELKSSVVAVHATGDSGTRLAGEKPRPAVAKKPQVLPKPARTGMKKTAMIPPDNKVLYQMIQEDHAQSPKHKPEVAPKPQTTALLPHFLKLQQPTEQSTKDADLKSVSRRLEGNMEDDRGPHSQNGPQDYVQDMAGPVPATSLPQPADDSSGLSKQLQTKSDDRLAALKTKLENQTLLSDQYHGGRDKAEIEPSGAGSKNSSPQEPINVEKSHPKAEMDPASRPDSSNYYSAIDCPSNEGTAPCKDDGSDNYYTVPGPPPKAAAARADSSAYYCVTDIVGESAEQLVSDVDYNVLKFDGKNAHADFSAGDDGGDEDSGHLYNRLNEGEDDDVYSHAETDGRKRQVIDDNYCHINL